MSESSTDRTYILHLVKILCVHFSRHNTFHVYTAHVQLQFLADFTIHCMLSFKRSYPLPHRVAITAINTEGLESSPVTRQVTTLPVESPLTPDTPTISDVTNVSALVSWTDPGMITMHK